MMLELGFLRVAHPFERVIEMEIHFAAQSGEEGKQGVGALVRDGSRDDDEYRPHPRRRARVSPLLSDEALGAATPWLPCPTPSAS
jgi:hypothetical protein